MSAGPVVVPLTLILPSIHLSVTQPATEMMGKTLQNWKNQLARRELRDILKCQKKFPMVLSECIPS